MPFPLDRPRRLRRTEALRTLVRETILSPDDLMWPLFVVPGQKVRNPVKSMPGVFQLSVDELVAEAQAGWEAGVRSVASSLLPTRSKSFSRGAKAGSRAGSTVEDSHHTPCPRVMAPAKLRRRMATDSASVAARP